MARQYLSIDVGGTAVKSARIDHSGNIIVRRRAVTPRDQAAFLHLLTTIIDRQPGVAAICVSVPGIVNPHTGAVKFTGALAFLGQFPLAAYLRQYAGLPVYVGNDANCATLAELWLGNLTGVANGAVITLGTSVGGGLVINGQLVHGPHFRAGELSAIVNNYDHAAPHQATVGASTSAVKMIATVATTCDLPDPTDGRRAFEVINRRQAPAWSIFTAFCRRVAVLMVNVQAVVDLERILIGGGISAQPILISEVRRQFRLLQEGDRRLMDDIAMPMIMAARFGNDANLLGALYGLLLKIEEEDPYNTP